MGLPYPNWNVVFNEQPTAAKWSELGANSDALAAGTGLNTNAVTADKLATNAITLGYAQIVTNFSTASTTVVQATGLTAAVTIPAGARRIKVTFFARDIINSTANDYASVTLWDGPVGTGSQISQGTDQAAVGNQNVPGICIAVVSPSAGSKTYNVGLQSIVGGTSQIEAASISPAFILVEAI